MGSSSHERGSASWSELPAGVLDTVLEGLAIRDLCRAGAVCRWWNAASSRVRAQHRALSRPRTPCLLYAAATGPSSSSPSASASASASSSAYASATLFSVTDGRSYPVPLTGDASIREGFWLGASHGWLVTVDEHAEAHLVNPVTGQRIDALPSVATVEQVRRMHDEGCAVVADTFTVYHYSWSLWVYDPPNAATTLDARELIDYLYVLAIISSDPSDADGDCVVVLVYWPDYQLCFARPGDAHWTWIQPPMENTQYCDCAFDGDGRTLYAMRHDGAIHAFDLHGRPALEREVVLRSQVPGGRSTTNYLVHAPWLRGSAGAGAGWLQVWRRMGATDRPAVTPAPAAHEESAWRTKSITVYQVDLAAQTLVQIKDLGDHALFVGCNYSFALDATDCPGILPNHVYYTDNEEHYALYSPQCPRDIGIYNVGDGNFHQVQPPCPWLNWPLPTWIMPSLCYYKG